MDAAAKGLDPEPVVFFDLTLGGMTTDLCVGGLP